MNNEHSSVERIVMQRVQRISRLRPLVSGGALSLALFAAALWGIGRAVWVARVFDNMPHGDLSALSHFALSAFSHTELVVQALTLLALVSLVYLARFLARPFSQMLTPAGA